MYVYNCMIIRWIDGDTVELEIDLGFRMRWRGPMRVHGINTPEMQSHNLNDYNKALQAKAHAEQLLPAGTKTRVWTVDGGEFFDKYGRFLARLSLPDGGDFTETMLRHGHGKMYLRDK